MTQTTNDLFLNKVPGKWDYIYQESGKMFTQQDLATWFDHLILRIEQLQRYGEDNINVPPSLWLPGLFNPMSFLTAIL